MSMSAYKKEEDFMSKITITATKVMKAPQYAKTAAGLLAACRSFYQNPENEAEYQKWKKGGKKIGRVSDRPFAGSHSGDRGNGDTERTA